VDFLFRFGAGGAVQLAALSIADTPPSAMFALLVGVLVDVVFAFIISFPLNY